MAKSREKKPKSETPIRENIELVLMALIVALLFKGFVFEVSRIPSGSMQPTLMGDAETGVFDRIAVDRLSFQYRDPERWEVVVFKHPLERSRDMVKRIVGMPGEELRIRGGDVWTRPDADAEWSILRKPDSVQRKFWRPLIPEDGAEAAWQPHAGEWSFSGRDLATPVAGEIFFPRGKTSIRDHYLDGYPEGMKSRMSRGRASSGSNDVPDVRLEGSFRPNADNAELRLVIQEGPVRHVFSLPGPAADPDLAPGAASTGVPALHMEEPTHLVAGEWSDFAFESVDDRLRVELEGEVLVELEIPPSNVNNLATQLTLTLAGGGGELRDAQVSRDIYYLPGRQMVGRDAVIPLGNYVMLGDNTQDSADGRDWEMATWRVPGEDGEPVEMRGNYRRTSLQQGGNPLDLLQPESSGGRRRIGQAQLMAVRDLWGQRHDVPRSGPVAGPEWAPLVPRELIRGRAVSVFWPVRPDLGVYRLSWIR